MAEFVDRRMERGLKELEQMVKVGLFSDEEVKSIVTKRMKMEYGVGRYGKTVEDHLKYIKYEMSFLELIKLRRKRLGYDFKINEIEGSVGKRCQLRLMRAENRHPASMEVWNLHVDLCRALNWHPAASQVFTRMLQIHSNKPEVWRQAADFELSENGSPDNARDLCMKALRWHEKNPDIWRHYLATELKIASKVFQRAAILGVTSANLVKGDDPIATGKLAMAVVRNAISTIPDVDFAASLYDTVQATRRTEDLPSELSKPLLDFISQQMEEACGGLPAYWKHRARFCLLPKSQVGKEEPVSQHASIMAEQAAFQILDAAVQKDSSGPMWQAYTDFLVELYALSSQQDVAWTELSKKRFEKAQEVFRLAENNDAIDFHRHINWAQILLARRKTQEALASLSNASAVIPTTIDGFVKLIGVYGAVPSASEFIIPLIRKAQETLSKDDPEFHQHLISWTLQYQPEKAESVFADALKQTRPVVSTTALPFLQWAYGQSLNEGREIYDQLRKTPGAFTETLIKWRIAEETRRAAPIDVLRKSFDAALAAHGVESADLWIDYIQLELTYPGGDALKSSSLVWKAQRTLKPEAVSLFMSMYNLIMLDESST